VIDRLVPLRILILLIAAAIGTGMAAAAETAFEVAPEPEPGDRGVMHTAIEGDRIEEIPVTYVGVQRNLIGPGYDVHLIQLEGPIADRVGVAAGMSGSPVYFDGKMLGAMAYRFGALPTEPIAGVTPIEDILRAAGAGTTAAAPEGSLVRPIGTPIQISGLTPVVRNWAEPQLEEFGFRLVAGGGAEGEGAPSSELSAGSPVGVALVRGDMSFAATGTVTLVDGDTVYAFGHPFLGSGQVEMPMVSASVVHTLADLAGSVKMASVGPEVGAILEDRLTAIVGRMGHQAQLIPLDVAVNGADYGEQNFHFEVARSSMLSPLLAAVAVANSLSSNVGYAQEVTMLTRGSIRVKGLPPIPLEAAGTSVGGLDPAVGVAVTLQQMLGSLWINPFDEVQLEGIEISVQVEPQVRRYQVEELHYDRGPLRGGQTLTVYCVLRPYRGENVTRRFDLTVPDDLPPNARLALAVGSPDQIDRALGQPLARRYRSANDLAAVADVLGDLRASNRLTAVIYHQASGVVSRGVAYSDLPPSAQKLLSARPRSGGTTTTRVADLVRIEQALDGPVDGGVVVRLQVDSGLENGDD
jgi:hypothetical protein